MNPIRWHRQYAGYYFARFLPTTMDGARVSVTAAVRHMPEWDGPDKWTAEIVGPEGAKLMRVGDGQWRTKRDAVEGVQAALTNGWTRFKFGGWCLA